MKISFAGMSGAYARFERFVPRRKSLGTALPYVIYTAVLFVCFWIYTLPIDVIARRLVNRVTADSGWDVHYDGVRLVPWAGLSFSNVSVSAPRTQGDPRIHLREISLRPSLRTFLGKGFRQGVFHGEAYGGSFAGGADWSDAVSLDFRWTDLNLAAYPSLSALLEGSWQGKFSGEVHLEGRNFPETLAGEGKLDLRAAALTGASAAGFKIPDLHFAQGASEFEIKAGKFDIRSFKLSGSEVDIELRGQIYIRKPIDQSVVNVTLSVSPLPGGASDIENALRLLNGNRVPANRKYSYSLYGTLSQLRIR